LPRVPDLPAIVAANIRAERARLGIHQDDLAIVLGVASSTVNVIESGKRPVKLDELLQICGGLGLTLKDLFRGLSDEDLRTLGL
jgi:transcriptional regulator with XRE-family HTH domain